MADLTTPQQRKADYLQDVRNVAAGIKSLEAIMTTINDDYTGQAYSAILNDAGFDPITFFFGENEGLDKTHVLNFMSTFKTAFDAMMTTHQATLANLSNNAKIYFE